MASGWGRTGQGQTGGDTVTFVPAQDLLHRLEAFGLASKIGPERLFPTLPTAVQAYEAWAQEHPLPPGAEQREDSGG